MTNVAQLDARLNDMVGQGKALEAFEEFYADDVVMIENHEVVRGKEANRVREQEFFGDVQEVHAAGIRASAVRGDTSFCEQFFDVTLKDGRRIELEEVSVRIWRDGKVIQERFYYQGDFA